MRLNPVRQNENTQKLNNIIKDSQKDKQVNINTVKLNWHKDGR